MKQNYFGEKIFVAKNIMKFIIHLSNGEIAEIKIDLKTYNK
jgi:hypothetical protein